MELTMLWFRGSSATRWPLAQAYVLKCAKSALLLVIADFLRRSTRAQHDKSCYCDECDSHCGSTLPCVDKRSSPTSHGISPSKQNGCSFVHLIVELLILRAWAVRFPIFVCFWLNR